MTAGRPHSPTRRRRPTRRGRLASIARWLAITGLLLQSLFPLLHRPAIAAGAALGDQIVICTGVGFKVVSAADLGIPAPEQAPGDAERELEIRCPGCLSSPLFAALVPQPQAVPQPSGDSVASPFAGERTFHPDRPYRLRPQPRAPPAVA